MKAAESAAHNNNARGFHVVTQCNSDAIDLSLKAKNPYARSVAGALNPRASNQTRERRILRGASSQLRVEANFALPAPGQNGRDLHAFPGSSAIMQCIISAASWHIRCTTSKGRNATKSQKGEQLMLRKTTILSGLIFSGAIALNGNLVWSQTGSSGGSSGAAGQGSGSSSSGSSQDKSGSAAGSSGAAKGSGSGSATGSSGAGSGSQMDRPGRSGGDATGQSSARGMGGQSSENVKQVQEALKNKGHDPGTADGVMGPKTQQALREFQKKNGMQATGRLDDKTASALGVDASGSGKGSASSGASSSSDKSSSGSGASSSGRGSSTDKSSSGSSTGGSSSGSSSGSSLGTGGSSGGGSGSSTGGTSGSGASGSGSSGSGSSTGGSSKSGSTGGSSSGGSSTGSPSGSGSSSK
jgi:peptidoglycan hydrolase-like protein with peptidoglycan-binding domain